MRLGVTGCLLLMLLMLLGGCDLMADRYRVEFEDGSWREIAFFPFSDEVRWREGCRNGQVLSDMTLPLVRQGEVNGKTQLLIGGERFEQAGKRLFRSNGMVLGHSPDFIQRGLYGLEQCRLLNMQRGALPRLSASGFGN